MDDGRIYESVSLLFRTPRLARVDVFLSSGVVVQYSLLLTIQLRIVAWLNGSSERGILLINRV